MFSNPAARALSALIVLLGTLLGADPDDALDDPPPESTTSTSTTSTTSTSTTSTTSTSTTSTTSTSTTTTTTIPDTGPPTAPPLDVRPLSLTKLRVTIDSSTPWTTVDLLGGSIVGSAQIGHVTDGAAQQYSPTGFSVQTATSARMTADMVFEIADDELEIVICKDSPGATSVRFERVTGEPVDVVHVTNQRADGVWDDGCANPQAHVIDASDAAPESRWPRPLSEERRTLAIYSPWYEADTFDEETFVDRPSTPHDVTNPADVSDMIARSLDAGIDGYVYWHNGETQDDRYDLLMNEAARYPGFAVAPQLDSSAILHEHGSLAAPVVAAWARHLLRHADHEAQLRVDGRPVLFVWGTHHLDAATWRSVRDTLRAEGLDPFVLGDSPDTDYDFDGLWVLNPNTVSETAVLGDWYLRWAEVARLGPERSLGDDPIMWAAGISPGEDDTHSGKSEDWWLQIPREGGARYDEVWQAASGSHPEWMVISSWNDFHEATYVLESERLGTLALDQTRAWTRWFSTED